MVPLMFSIEGALSNLSHRQAADSEGDIIANFPLFALCQDPPLSTRYLLSRHTVHVHRSA